MKTSCMFLVLGVGRFFGRGFFFNVLIFCGKRAGRLVAEAVVERVPNAGEGARASADSVAPAEALLEASAHGLVLAALLALMAAAFLVRAVVQRHAGVVLRRQRRHYVRYLHGPAAVVGPRRRRVGPCAAAGRRRRRYLPRRSRMPYHLPGFPGLTLLLFAPALALLFTLLLLALTLALALAGGDRPVGNFLILTVDLGAYRLARSGVVAHTLGVLVATDAAAAGARFGPVLLVRWILCDDNLLDGSRSLRSCGRGDRGERGRVALPLLLANKIPLPLMVKVAVTFPLLNQLPI